MAGGIDRGTLFGASAALRTLARADDGRRGTPRRGPARSPSRRGLGDLGRGGEPAGLQLGEQLAPAPGALAHAGLEAHELLPALGRGADHDQPALGRVRPIGLTHAGLEAHPVGPDGDVSGAPRDHGAASGRGPPPDRPSAARSPKPRGSGRRAREGPRAPRRSRPSRRRADTAPAAAHRGSSSGAPIGAGSLTRTAPARPRPGRGREPSAGAPARGPRRSGSPARARRRGAPRAGARPRAAPPRRRRRGASASATGAQAEEAPCPLARGRRRRVVDLVALAERPDAGRSAHRRIAPPGGPGRLDTRHDTPPSQIAVTQCGAASVTIWRRTMPCLRSIQTWDL